MELSENLEDLTLNELVIYTNKLADSEKKVQLQKVLTRYFQINKNIGNSLELLPL